jgi:Flp pilus assembly pilin Flp
MLSATILRIVLALQPLRRMDAGQTFAEYGVIVSAIALAAGLICGIAFRETVGEAWRAVF